MIYLTPSARHLTIEDHGSFEIIRFDDGEIFLKVHDDVRGKSVWVIASTLPPTDNFFELFFLLSALQDSGAIINVIITYLGYARQDRPQYGEAASLKVITSFLKCFSLNKLFIVHPHSQKVEQLINGIPVLPVSLFQTVIKEYDIVVMPDKGAVRWAKDIAKQAGKPFIFIEKERVSDTEIEVRSIQEEDIAEKRCIIIDDIIASGGTMVKESSLLMDRGAREVSCIATHAVFGKKTKERIAQSQLKNVYVTNSTSPVVGDEKIHVLDITSMVKQIIEEG